jgi:hypothetical protein
MAWTDASAHPQTTPINSGSFAIQHCAAPPTWVRSQPVTGQGAVEAIARGESPDATLDALAVKVRTTASGTCPTIGLKAPGGDLGLHVATYCVATTVTHQDRFIAHAQRAARIANRALLVGLADPAKVRWIEVETEGGAFLVRPSRSGAFFVAYPDSQRNGRQWRLRAALRGPAPIRFTAYRTVVLGPTTTNVVPPGAARAISPDLLVHFAVFRRPRGPRDELPRRPGSEVFHYGDTNPNLSRFLGADGGTRFFAVPGRRDLCLIEKSKLGGSVGCGRAAHNTNPATPIGGSSIVHRGILAYALLPDGIDHVNVQRNDGSRYTRAVRDNFFAVRSTTGLHRIWWTTPNGKTASLPGISHTGLGTRR